MLENLNSGETFHGRVLVSDWSELPFRKKQGSYVSMTCQDRSGEITAKIWEPTKEQLDLLRNKRVFSINAKVVEYRGEQELEIVDLEPVEPAEIDMSEFLPSSPHTPDELEQQLAALLQKIVNPALRALAQSILDDPKLGPAFRQAPAAKKMHQAYLRGLLEHSLGVADIALGIGQCYPDLDLDLLVFGALFHDIGKTEELAFDEKMGYTDDGRLMGHIVLEVQILDKFIGSIPEYPNARPTF